MKRREFLTRVAAAALATGAATARRPARAADEACDVVIVGGGIAGLAAAYLLAEGDILVLERGRIPGGRISSGTWKGFRYARGTEYIGEPDGVIAEWFDELGIRPVAIPPPTGAVAYQGEIYTGRDILGFLPSRKALRDYGRLADVFDDLDAGAIEEALFEGPAALRKFAALDRLSVQDWLTDEGFDPLVRKLVDVENRGLFGAANADLSLLFDVPEMAWNLHDPDEADESGVYTFRGGMIEVPEAAARALGRRVVTGAEATAVEVLADGLVRVRYRAGGRERVATARSAILATPSPVTAALVKTGLSPAVRRTLASIDYAAYVTVNLFLTERVWSEAWSLASLDDPFVTLYDAIRTQVRPGYTERGILGVYFAPERAADRSLLRMSDRRIVDTTVKALARYDPDIAAKVVGFDVHRFEHAFPVFRPGYLSILESLYRDRTARGPLVLAGDYLVYPTFDGAVASGVRAAEAVDAFL